MKLGIKPDEFKGTRFKGTAELSSEGTAFDMLVQAIKGQGIPVPPPKFAVTIRVDEVRALGEG
ncbi:MAG: hypothetical protein GY910_26610 [bacterium]|nr:hypothetical protein [bacterium]